jgi:hypothetical protein
MTLKKCRHICKLIYRNIGIILSNVVLLACGQAEKPHRRTIVAKHLHDTHKAPHAGLAAWSFGRQRSNLRAHLCLTFAMQQNSCAKPSNNNTKHHASA